MKFQKTRNDYRIPLYVDEFKKIISDVKFLDFATSFTSSVIYTYKLGRSVYLCGNGGNAGTLSHIACDLNMHPFVSEDKSGFPKRTYGFRAINLCESPSMITAATNDNGWHNVFSSQLSNTGFGDIVLLVSGSGNSENTKAAAALASYKRLTTFGFARRSDCALQKICTYFYCVGNGFESKFPGQVGSNNCNFYFEDMLLMLGHIATGMLKNFVEKEGCKNDKSEQASTARSRYGVQKENRPHRGCFLNS